MSHYNIIIHRAVAVAVIMKSSSLYTHYVLETASVISQHFSTHDDYVLKCLPAFSHSATVIVSFLIIIIIIITAVMCKILLKSILKIQNKML